MDVISMLLAPLVLLVVAGLLGWLFKAMLAAAADLESLGDFEGMHGDQ